MQINKNESKLYADRAYNMFRKAKTSEDEDLQRSMITKLISCLYKYDQKNLDDILNSYEGMSMYNNYLTQKECEEICDHSINEDGSHGCALGDCRYIVEFLQNKGNLVENSPYYNKWALIATMHKFASDQGSVLKKLVEGDRSKYIQACYDLAVAQLKDPDKERWVRWYFNI